MQAIILAAGMGKRLKELTANNTKCMVKVNGITLIERMLTQLDKLNLNKVVIVIGYEGEKLVDFIKSLPIKTPIEFIDNPIYYKTNNIYSLSLAKDCLLLEDTLLLESDIIFEDDVLKALIDDKRDTLALVDKYESWMDGTVVKLDKDDSIIDFIPGKKFDYKDINSYYKTVNIYKFSKEFSITHYVPFLDAYSKALGNNEYYEQVLRVIALLDNPIIKAKRLMGQKWYEIDDIQDLDIASSMFTDNDDKLIRIQNRYGGYWRYPKLIDFCYLVNPYFPPEKMINEMKSNFEILLRQYPSGMQVNSLLAAKNFGVLQEHIVVGNGAAEIIKELMLHFQGKTGFIRPTFEEYPNRYEADKDVVFIPDNIDYTYTAEDIINYFNSKELDNLIVINPDNPTGNYISKKDLIRLIEWSHQKEIKLIIDESFVDFADEADASIIYEEILEKYPNLIVVKSISKSYGVPGLRLGIAASSDKKLISMLKKKMAIWNINSFGEFYMQIEEKYKKDYEKSLIKIREARKEFVRGLSDFESLRVIPSQANYIMCQVIAPFNAKDITKELLAKYNILIKDLTSKCGYNKNQYIRIAVKTIEENAILINALKDIMK